MALISGLTNLIKPTRSSDGINQTTRLDPHGAMLIGERLIATDVQALEGSRFLARATPAAGGTGVGIGIQTAFSDTANITVILVNGSTSVYGILDFIKYRYTVAGGSTTSVEMAFEIDPTNRYSSGGTSLTVNKVNPNGPASVMSQVRHAAITAAAAGGSRSWLGQQLVRSAIPIVNDTFIYTFGAYRVATASAPFVINTATNPNVYAFPWNSPVVIPPGGSFLLHLAHVANAATAPSLDTEIGWTEI